MPTYQIIVLRDGYLTGLSYQRPLRTLEQAREIARGMVQILADLGAVPVVEERAPDEEPILHSVILAADEKPRPLR